MKKIIFAFAAGQLVQIVCHLTCFNWWQQYQVPFCVAGGVLVLMAVIAGAWIATHGVEPQKPKSYTDYAKEYADEQ